MLCKNCAKLAFVKTKACKRCQGRIFINIHILCDNCSNTEKKCAICAKLIVQPKPKKGCNCGK